jgi:CheY-like chemotaxis protein
MLGVPAATLRTWEERYGSVVPERTSGGQRIYSRHQLEQLRVVKTHIDEGMQPAEAFRLLAEHPADGQLPEPDDGKTMLILLAERDPFAARLAEYFLSTEGFRVELATSTGDAERRFARTMPELAIVELLIEGGGGVDLCRTLRSMGDVPIVAISALDARDESLAAGADAFLRKPVDPLELVSTVRDLLRDSAFLRMRRGALR